MRHRLAAWFTGLMVLASCATPPPARDIEPGERPAEDSDEAGLWRMMERDEYKIRTSSDVVRDPQLQAYLESVLCDTVGEYCQDIRLYVVPSYRLNASMAPNGMMIVETGLLLRLSNEAQLAAILGHEVAHYSKRHSLNQWRDLRAKTNTLGAMTAVLQAGISVATTNANAAAASGNYAGAANSAGLADTLYYGGSALLISLEAMSILGAMQYSRGQETDSDAIGLSSMASAGYAPEASVAIWKVMQSEEKADAPEVPGYLRSHPALPDRIAFIERRVNILRRDHPDANRVAQAEYMRQIEPFRHAWLQHARGGLTPELEKLLLERQREIGARPGLVLFHEAQMIRRRNDEGDRLLAMETFREALRSEGHPPETHRELGLVLWDLGKTEEAHQAFGLYLANHPGAADGAIIRHYMEELRE